MNKLEFLDLLRARLSGLPESDVAERLSFYGEMIDDRVEDGLTEEAAVAEIGPVDQIAAQILEETPLTRLVREKLRPKRRLQAWEIVLLALGAPVWIPLLIAACVVVFAVYVVLWALLAALWAVELTFAVCAVGGVAAGIVQLCQGEGLQGLVLLSAGFVLAGLSVFLFFGCLAAGKGVLRLTKKIALWIKSLFLRKENTK